MFELYITFMKTWFAQNLQYRFALLIWLIGFVLEPVIYMLVWSTVAQARGGSVGGYAPGDFATYFIGSMLLSHLTFDWHFFEIEPRVRNGNFSPLLLRPVHPIHSDLADNLVYKMMTLPFVLAAAVGVYFAFGAKFDPPAWAALLFIPALLQAFALRFLLEWTLGLCAFWTTRVQAIVTMYITCAIFLSGRMAPLSLLPEWAQRITHALPFRLWISFPVELMLGRYTFDAAISDLITQSIWIAVALLILKFVWSRGMKRYSAVGA